MLNSKKLLYVFSDVAYVAELLPAKKEGDFKVQEFRQINGEFLNNDTFIAENIEKLFSKLDPEEYLLVLPDFFFTNTIIEIKEKAKTKIEKHVEEKLLPSLNLSDKTHQLSHFVLTQYGDKSNVQLSAIERSLLAPIYDAAQKHKIKITKAVSLSWTVKALISLEPSLSLVQMGENLYLVQHYIGIDQATSAPVSDVEKIGETIKTLKGAEPSIQTMYLLTNELVEEKLKEILKATIPLQQLSDFKDDKSDLPSYVKQAIEAGAKTMSVPDFKVPEFKVEAVDAELIEEAKGGKKTKKAKEDKTEEKEVEAKEETKKEEKPTEVEEEETMKEELPEMDVVGGGATDLSEEPLPAPTTPPEKKEEVEEEITEVSPEEKDSVTKETVVEEASDEKNDIVKNKEEEPKPDMQEDNKPLESQPEVEETKSQPEEAAKDDALSQFAVIDGGDEEKEEPKKETTTEDKPKDMPSEKETPAVIKNKTGVSSMLRMVFVSVSVFFLTVGIGVGLGFGYLNLSNKTDEDKTPEVITEDVGEEVAEASPTPSPEPEVDKETIEILVVNATTKAGYAGEIKTALTAADFEEVDAGNAKGDYTKGNYLLMSEENKGLISLIEEATDLEFEFSDEIKTEDVKGSYDAVVVLSQ